MTKYFVIVKARKPRRCHKCKRVIRPGEYYVVFHEWAWYTRGYHWNTPYCLECARKVFGLDPALFVKYGAKKLRVIRRAKPSPDGKMLVPYLEFEPMETEKLSDKARRELEQYLLVGVTSRGCPGYQH